MKKEVARAAVTPELGKWLAGRREAVGLRQQDLEDQDGGLSRSTVIRIETAKTPSVLAKSMIAYCLAINLRPDTARQAGWTELADMLQGYLDADAAVAARVRLAADKADLKAHLEAQIAELQASLRQLED